MLILGASYKVEGERQLRLPHLCTAGFRQSTANKKQNKQTQAPAGFMNHAVNTHLQQESAPASRCIMIEMSSDLCSTYLSIIKVCTACCQHHIHCTSVVLPQQECKSHNTDARATTQRE